MGRVLSPVSVAVLCVLAGLVGLLAYGLASNEPDRDIDEALARGEREAAPALELPALAGEGTASLSDYRGQVVVLNFWASWCKPCREESPLLQRWHRRLQPQGGTVLGVDVQDIDSDARKFIDEFKLTYPHLRDKEGDDMRADWGAVSYPETFVLDRQGRVAALIRGPVDEEFMRTGVQPLLEETQ